MQLEHCNPIARDPERVRRASYLLRNLLKRRRVKIKEVPVFRGSSFKLEITFGWFYFRRILLKIEHFQRFEDGFDLGRVEVGKSNDLDVCMYVGRQEAFYCCVPTFLLQQFLDRMDVIAEEGLEKEEEKEIKIAKSLFGIYFKKLRLTKSYLEKNADAAWDFILKNDYDTSKLSKCAIRNMHREYLELKIFKKEHIDD